MSAFYPTELPIQPKLSRPMETREQRFEAFDAEHPEVFTAIVKSAHDQLPKRIMHMRKMVEVIRDDFPGLGIDNNHIPFYVDKLEAKYPIFQGRFFKRARAIKKMKRVYAE